MTRPMPFRYLLLLTLLLSTVSSCATMRFFDGEDTEKITKKATSDAECVGEDCDISEKTDAVVGTSELYETPVPVETRDLEFSSRGQTLTGTVYLPEDLDAPRPAAVLLHDWGPRGREGIVRDAFGVELSVEIPLYELLAERLASHGMIVFVYDKRTCVKGTAPWCTYPRSYVEQHQDDIALALVEDARAGLSALADLEVVDRGALHVIGHGHGADIALVVTEQKSVQTATLLAPSPYPPDAVIQHQTEASIALIEKELEGKEATAGGDLMKIQLEELKRLRDMQPAVFEKIRAGEDPEETFGLSANAWRSFLELHERATKTLTERSEPVLVVLGELDFNIPDDSVALFEERLEDRPGGKLVVFPDLTHLLVDVGPETDPTILSEDVVDAMLTFYREHL